MTGQPLKAAGLFFVYIDNMLTFIIIYATIQKDIMMSNERRNTMQEAIQVKQLNKSYQRRQALHNLSFTVHEGEILGLLGPNGAGKSTAINILSTVLRPDNGEVRILGYDLKSDKKKIKHEIGIVPQDLAIYEEISAKRNVRFFASLYGLSGSALKSRTKEALQLVGLYDRRTEKPKAFSGGMKRRLNIACAIAHKPKIIIMDEPTVGIDPQSRNHILESILTLQKNGATILYSTHYMEEVEEISNRILIMDEGKLIASGTKEELCKQVESQLTYFFTVDQPPKFNETTFASINGIQKVDIKENNIAVTVDINHHNIGDIVAIINSAGCNLQNMTSKKLSLETVFLNLTGKSLRD